MSKKLTPWKKGAPPMIGEWNASINRNEGFRRWWDGENWSLAYHKDASEGTKRRNRRIKRNTRGATGVEWRGLAEQPAKFVAPKPLEPL